MRYITYAKQMKALRKTQPDETDLKWLSRFKGGDWTAAGAVSVPSTSVQRLVRLGLLDMRTTPLGLKVSRTWDYRITAKGQERLAIHARILELKNEGKDFRSNPDVQSGTILI